MKRITLLVIILFLNQLSFSQNGIIKSYYPNRNIKSEISYINDILDGKSIYYFENGNKKSEQNYSRGILNGWVRSYYENGKLKNEFYVENGIKDGDEKTYNFNGELISILTYQKGVLIKEQLFSDTEQNNLASRNYEIKSINNFKDAYPIGGIEEIQSKIKYPNDALKFGLEGKVKMKIKLDETGKVEDIKIIQSLGLGCDEEAKRVIKETRFMPARENDKFVKSELDLEINFIIPKQEEVVSNVKENEKTFLENISVICNADECPKPIDDLKTIYSRITIPNVAKALKINGIITIEAFVNLDGELTKTSLINGIGYGCDQLVIDSLKKSKFSLAKKNGKTIESKFIINFPFNYDFQ
ncbi:MAG: TonB family protein [Melioribacteraceae bacterium]|nr:TonB family protein [Melioribacteraceae bacterium]